MFSLYGPDMTNDGLLFDKGMWVYQKDVIIKNNSDTDGKNPKLEKYRVTKKLR
jgi:hypothetical protein